MMESFAAAARRRYLLETVQMVRDHYPEYSFDRPEKEIEARCSELMDAAAQFGIDTERAVTRFVQYHFDFGDDFLDSEDWAWARNILHAPDLPGEQKILQIDDTVNGGPMWEENVREEIQG